MEKERSQAEEKGRKFEHFDILAIFGLKMTKSQGSHRAKMVENLFIVFFCELDHFEHFRKKKFSKNFSR